MFNPPPASAVCSSNARRANLPCDLAWRFGTVTRLTTIEIADAADFHALSERLPDSNKRHCYRLRDPAAAAEAGPPLSRHVLRAAGTLQVSQVMERLGTQVLIHEPGIPAFCFSTLHTGAMSLSVPNSPEVVEGRPERGLIHGGQGGTRALTANGTARTNLWVAGAAIQDALVMLLDDVPHGALAFQPVVDWTTGAGPSVRRLLDHAAAEFECADGMGVQPLVLAGFTDLFVHTVLAGLPHSHSERLARQRADTAPRHLRQAEAFMRAHATQPIRLADVALAVGCSLRSLQNAFRAFRGTTPHAALLGIRLELARTALHRGEDVVAAVARRHGFSNVGRFAAAYARRFGERPQRTRGSR
ncbi:helix-turn-helix transcriptional regulator [Roseomonas haemaphysalidis]|uniref:Helix-turn-helix transcriptional regulator n=1 Tax=Roseomonas haemaphysalidis TaxID=2768162 RepID=A0ABS3KXM6_9PROT|nr:AraC family transcriptional regulator [Roseomonas haemaphysalidis]MBO1081710.1 helix-turn-helix transcriptional regulator [Roseomonas haemaphysalidis]